MFGSRQMRRPAGETWDFKLPARIFAVLAAVNLVGFVALATLVPDMSLFEAVHVLDTARADAAQASLINLLGRDLWNAILVPVLLRPVWFGPLSLGLIFVGGGCSFSFHASPRPNHRQS
jgi:hypothetical protein